MLSVRGIAVGYGQRSVLKGIDLDVETCEVVGLVGPNGCGKTTLLKALTRVVPWTSGDVSLDGVSILAIAPRELARRVAVVPQNPVLPVGFTAIEVVLMGRTPHLGFLEQEGSRDFEKARAALALVGASGFAERRVDELSGGERQNVVLARTLAQEAPLLLLDEPTANLDIGHQIAVASLLRRLARTRRMAVLAALHDLTLAALYCDRLVLMSEGAVIAAGPPAAVLTGAHIARAYDAAPLILADESLPTPVVLPLADVDIAGG